MSKGERDDARDPDDSVEDFYGDLPPLDHDEPAEVEKGELEELVVPLADEGFLDAHEDKPLVDELAVAQELIDAAEASWFDGGDDEAPTVGDIVLIESDEHESWAGGDNDAGDVLDDGWFVPGEEESTVEDDGGVEGPLVDDNYDLRTPEWDEPDEECDGGDESILETMDRLGIEVPLPKCGDPDDPAPSCLLDSQYLGPELGRATAATFHGGSPVAVGDAFYVLGADGMLHPVFGSHRIADKAPRSIFSWKESVFFGTGRGGSLVTEDCGASFTAVNNWYLRGLEPTKFQATDRISTAFEIRGQSFEGGCRIFGYTGEGHLFTSVDAGLTWSGPVINERCRAVCPVSGAEKVALLVEAVDGMFLETGDGLAGWRRSRLPEEVTKAVSTGEVLFDASANAIALGGGRARGRLFYTLDEGGSWQEIESAVSITAVAIEPDTPGWLVLAEYDEERELGLVKVSEDGGVSWATVLRTGSTTHQSTGGGGQSRPGKVLSLAVRLGSTRQLLVLETGGVHLLTLSRPGVAH
jgi:hypothetical protein